MPGQFFVTFIVNAFLLVRLCSPTDRGTWMHVLRQSSSFFAILLAQKGWEYYFFNILSVGLCKIIFPNVCIKIVYMNATLNICYYHIIHQIFKFKFYKRIIAVKCIIYIKPETFLYHCGIAATFMSDHSYL